MKLINKVLFVLPCLLLLFGCGKKTTKDEPKTTQTIPVEKFVVEFDSNGGSYVSSQNVVKGGYASKPVDPTKKGYTFDGWFYEDSKFIFDAFAISKDMKLIARWTNNNYDVNLSQNIDLAGTISGSGTYEYNSTVTLTAMTNTGYTFDGWYNGDNRLATEEEYSFTMPNNDVTYTAKWSPLKYTITLDNQVEGLTITGITSGESYDYNSLITLTASNIPSSKPIKWSRSDGIEYVGDSYSFNVPAEDITITTTTLHYTRSGNKIYFGYYPQTLETDSKTKDNLNILAGTLPTSSNTYNWTSYGYYIGGNVSNYMWYIDLDTNDDGRFDYRGVYFTSYRPDYTTNSSSAYSRQNSNGYVINEVYWFKYEIIEWNILKEENGKAMLIVNLILDSQDYYPSFSDGGSFSHNDGTGYANNYELSNIRKWLNDNFYNTAFNDLEKEIIQSTLVNNSASTTNSSPNSYACYNTNDKIFILSYKEATTTAYFANSSARHASGSDYAKAQGLDTSSDGYANWRLRSPYEYDGSFVYYVNSYGDIIFNDVYYTDCGVRPVLWIGL